MIHPRESERPPTSPAASWRTQRPPGATLSDLHRAYLRERGVTDEVIDAAGYWSAWRPSGHPDAFNPYQRRRHPALIASHLSPDGKTTSWQKRDDRPAVVDGKPLKWVSPPGDRARPVLSVHPWMLEEVNAGTAPLWIVEGLTRGHALAGLGIPAVTYAGCYSWQKDGEPLECWRHVNLQGRLVYDVPDADARTNENVQEAQARRVAYLESRGARVLVVSVPEIGGDEHAGLDDYIAAGGNPSELARSAEPFVRRNVGRERLKRDERLRLFRAAKQRELREHPARKVGDCGAVKVGRYLVEVSLPAHGKLQERGAVVHPSLRQIAAGVRMGVGAVRNGLNRLEASGFLETLDKPRARHEAASYLLLDPSLGGSRLGEHKEKRGAAGKESQEHRAPGTTSLYQRDSSSGVHSTYTNMKSEKASEKLPPLRNSKLVHTWGRKNGRRVVVHSDYFKRYGAKGEEIVRYVLEGGQAEVTELWERFGSTTSRLRGFFNTWIRPIIDDGVFAGGVDSVAMAPNWREALQRVRVGTDEDLDNRLQDQRYVNQRAAYRQAKDNPTDPTPDLAGPERVAEIVAKSREREEAARVEEQRRKVGMTAEVFLADALQDASGFGWRELRALWIAKGGKAEDLRRAVKNPYQFRREGGDTGALYVIKTGTTPEPERDRPATVAVLREPENLIKPEINTPKRKDHLHKTTRPREVAGIYQHGPLCDCEWCDAPVQPKYATTWSGT